MCSDVGLKGKCGMINSLQKQMFFFFLNILNLSFFLKKETIKEHLDFFLHLFLQINLVDL